MSFKKKPSGGDEPCFITRLLTPSEEQKQFLGLLANVTGLSKFDQRKYARIFMMEKVRGVDQLAKMDASALKAIGIPMGDAIEIVDTLRTMSTSKLIQEHSSSSLSIEDAEDAISNIPELPAGAEYYAFASHNWGSAESNFLNHARTTKLIEKFKEHNIPIWFDHDKLSGTIESQITKGIDKAATFLVFVTKDYVEKVMSGGESEKTDWCHYEFVYAGQQKPHKMIPIVMEPEMLDNVKWKGPVGARLGGKIFDDFSSDDKLESCVVDICSLISAAM